MVINLCIIYLLAFLAATRNQIWIQYSNLYGQEQAIYKYLIGLKQGYYLDLGGYNGIMNSNTIKLGTWNGLIVEANEKRAADTRDLQPHVQVLNFAISNETGVNVPFCEIDVASSISPGVASDKPCVWQNVSVINLADLCHKYYKGKPTLMNIDVEGVGETALLSNDWTDQKCFPDLIYAEDFIVNVNAGQPNLQKVVLSHNYTKMQRVQINSLFIHNSKLEFYKKQAEKNARFISNKVSYSWQNQFSRSTLTALLGQNFPSMYIPSTHPGYVYFRQLEMISIMEINKYSNLISTVGKNRPIIIMEYDKDKSTIYLGTDDYKVSDKTVGRFNFKEIIANYNGESLKVYVLDHQKHDDFEVKILQEKAKVKTPQSTPPVSQPTKRISQQSINLVQEEIRSSIKTAQESHELNTEKQLKQMREQIKALINSEKISIVNSASQSWVLAFILLILISILLIILFRKSKKQRKIGHGNSLSPSQMSMSVR